MTVGDKVWYWKRVHGGVVNNFHKVRATIRKVNKERVRIAFHWKGSMLVRNVGKDNLEVINEDS